MIFSYIKSVRKWTTLTKLKVSYLPRIASTPLNKIKNEKSRIAITAINEMIGSKLAITEINGTLRSANPAKMQAKYKNIILSIVVPPFFCDTTSYVQLKKKVSKAKRKRGILRR